MALVGGAELVCYMPAVPLVIWSAFPRLRRVRLWRGVVAMAG
jgi:hypothetical protein